MVVVQTTGPAAAGAETKAPTAHHAATAEDPAATAKQKLDLNLVLLAMDPISPAADPVVMVAN